MAMMELGGASRSDWGLSGRGSRHELASAQAIKRPRLSREVPGPSLRRVVAKSALLNLTIILTSFPVLVFAGGPDAVILTLAIMAGISVLIWTVTFTLFSFVSLARIFCTPTAARKPSPSYPRSAETGVADSWLDESV